MKLDKDSLILYVVTDRSWLKENPLAFEVEKTLKAGATFIQLREKEMSDEEFLKEAIEIKALTDKYKVPFVINDNIDIALKVNADGVHVGQSDMDAKNVRKLIGPDKILGVSASNAEQAKKAEQSGADYLGVGAVFSTSTKKDADNVSFETLKEICQSVSIPVIAIGGINEGNLYKLKNSGIVGVAVISAILAKSDIIEATKTIRKLCEVNFK